ncbi:MAG TPA: phage tail sheath C-terminal domain-containing protein [Bacteroidales bacterium]|nr:phage tail sheath C-terminal domain-containing protein [Bacteroidales bacterium]
MAQTLATPGVYIEERKSFPNSVAGIPTAVPAFVGYTEKVVKSGESLINKPVRITSFSEFVSIFGEGFKTTFNIEEVTDLEKGYDLTIDGKYYVVNQEKKARFLLFDGIRLFFENGGSTCYIVSVGSYTTVKETAVKAAAKTDKDSPAAAPAKSSVTEIKVNELSKKALSDGIKSLLAVEEPTMLVIPEAVMLEEGDCFALQQEMLLHCGLKMKNRFAIVDVYRGDQPRSYDKNDVITRFREGIGSNFLEYSAAYYPFVNTAVVQKEEVNIKNIANLDLLNTLLSKEADAIFENPKKADEAKNEIKKLIDEKVDADTLTQTLNAISPAFKKVISAVLRKLNVLPPSSAMAGAYSMVDNTRGVWKSPANLSLGSVISPSVSLTNEDQEDLNVTVSGKSINAIRSFVGQGTLVWGARTLNGNSQDWKYINVRRTLIFIEQSVKAAAKAYVYEPNTSGTWTLVRSMISSFLTGIWKQGGLAGLTPADAFEVEVGLGSTMTPNDILDGIMNVTVKVAVTRPAEFIVITFQQKMQQS